MIDGVAYAPHHAPDVRAIGADWYVYSPYKVFGPHMGALFATHGALDPLTGPNHFFIPKAELPRKWEPGGVSHEACAGLLALGTFAKQVLGLPASTNVTRQILVDAMNALVALEQGLQKQLLEGLQKHQQIRIVGPVTSGRVATVSFLHAGESSATFAKRANAAGLGVRYGHFYSKRLLEEMGIDPREGVIRASLVGYNSPEDVSRLLGLLQT
jgi:selenocysteine lyase/cysteine desulfurase